ncbi:MAG: DUF3341 domain-containing protein [Algisphaera sp.]
MTALDSPNAAASTTLPARTESADGEKIFAVIAEFDNVTDVLAATQAAHDAGYRQMDVHSPFPIHGIDDALGVKPTVLPWLVLGMGLLGMSAGVFLTTFTMTDFLPQPDFVPENFHGYKFLISGKPLNSFAAYIPVIFEMTIMFAAYTAVFAMFLLNKLPLLYHPLLKSENFRRSTQDRFFLAIESRDSGFDIQKTPAFLKEQGALTTELIHD